MKVFTSEELQRRPAEVQQSAFVEPAYITFHGRPRLVVMSVDEFERMSGRQRLAMNSIELSEDIVAEITEMADAYPVPVM